MGFCESVRLTDGLEGDEVVEGDITDGERDASDEAARTASISVLGLVNMGRIDGDGKAKEDPEFLLGMRNGFKSGVPGCLPDSAGNFRQR